MRHRYICEYCGANLDPGERCEDCRRKKVQQDKLLSQVREGKDGQMRLNLGYNGYWRQRA